MQSKILTLRRSSSAVVCLLLTLLLSACAIKNAPQVDKETQWRLNTASQLADLQANYITFFTDLGNAQRANLVTTRDVDRLNEIGARLKPAIEVANREWQAYIAAPSDDKRTQVINLLLTAEQVMLELTTRRTNLGGIQ